MAAVAVVAVAGSNTIVIGGGCFWCLDALFSLVNGVHDVTCGYAGGKTDNPTYEAVCSGSTGHAEVVKITFDETVISLHEIFAIFWATHDPTTPNQQGADIGTQYRSIILYADEAQKNSAQDALAQAQQWWAQPIVTEIQPLRTFYEAEPYHQDYFLHNPNQAYCQIVINPKLAHFRSSFRKYLKTDQ